MRKIITISYYADFSRFYHYTLSQLQAPSIYHTDLSLNLSSYFYGVVNGINNKFLPHEVSKKSIIVENQELKAFSSKYKDNYYSDNEPSWYKNKRAQYLNYFYDFFEKEKIDLVIISGDSRVAAHSCGIVCKMLGINAVYMEQGPCNTTILDKNGVNANCSFRNTLGVSKDGMYVDKKKMEKVKKWAGYKKYRLIDKFSSRFVNLLYKEAELEPLMSFKRRVKKRNLRTKEFKGNILLILQVPHDVNMKVHSPYFSNHFDIVKTVSQALPSGFLLKVREHPLYTGKYEKKLYDFILSKDDIELSTTESLNHSIITSDLSIVNNSTVGLETLFLGKPLLVLGNAYYDNSEYVYKYEGKDLGEMIANAIANPKPDYLVANRINYLFNHHFIDGHFRDDDNTRFLNVARKVDELLL